MNLGVKMGKWDELASNDEIERTMESLKKNGIEAHLVTNGEEARKKVFELIPEGSEVMTMTSMTLQALGLATEINESGKFDSVRKKLSRMDSTTQKQEMRRLGAAPQFCIGSVHAVTEDGHCLIASATGSQLPAYAYGAGRVVWVVGAQKVVKNVDEGTKRVYEHSFPLEDARARKAYGTGSGVNKLLVFNREATAGRVALILVKEKLGF
jgi:hypothetical protein